MRRTTKHLNGKCRLNAARAFFQIPDVLFLGFADAAQRGAEGDTDAVLWFFAGIIDVRVVQRALCRYDAELRVAAEPFEPVRWKKPVRIPVTDLAGPPHPKHTWI